MKHKKLQDCNAHNKIWKSAKDLGGGTPTTLPHSPTPARPSWRRGRGTEATAQHQRQSPAPHPTVRLLTATRGALRADPRRPPHWRHRLGRQAPQGTARGGGRRGRRWQRELGFCPPGRLGGGDPRSGWLFSQYNRKSFFFRKMIQITRGIARAVLRARSRRIKCHRA
jgi:hypothetical protein